MVPRRGFEPPCPCERHHLKVMRIPVPPPGLNILNLPNNYSRNSSVLQEDGELTPMGYELDNLWVTVFTKGKGEIKDLCLKPALTLNN